MEETVKEPKKHVSLLGVVISHFILGLGVAAIGRGMNNKKELYGGLLLMALIIVSAYGIGFVSPCPSSCDYYPAELVYYVTDCEGCIWVDLGGIVSFFLSLGSWIYIIARLVMIHRSEDGQVRLL
jgi:hypothetical protein